MKYWHINSSSYRNKIHMIERNYCYIGLGKDLNEYEQRIKNKNATPNQFFRFKEEAQNGDIILLYQNKKGYIAYGRFTGEINEPTMDHDLAPDWSKTEIQKHIQVDSWNFIDNPSTKYFKRKTLVEIKKDQVNNIINL